MSFSNGTSWKSWSGITFENICMKHALALKSSLGIENVHSETSVWRSKPRNEEKGAQIALLIDRKDRCINVCEIKFSTGTFEISKKYAAESTEERREGKACVSRGSTRWWPKH